MKRRVKGPKHREEWAKYKDKYEDKLQELFTNRNYSKPIIYSVDAEDVKEVSNQLLNLNSKFMWVNLGVRSSEVKPEVNVFVLYLTFGDTYVDPTEEVQGIEIESDVTIDPSTKELDEKNLAEAIDKVIPGLGSEIISNERAVLEVQKWLDDEIKLCKFQTKDENKDWVLRYTFDPVQNLVEEGYTLNSIIKYLKNINTVSIKLAYVDYSTDPDKQNWPEFTMVLYHKSTEPLIKEVDNGKGLSITEKKYGFNENVAKPCPPICSEKSD